MSLHIFRVTVRGQFAELEPSQRAALLAVADDHSVFRSAYTREGTFTYEPNLVAFNFRYEIREPDDDGRDARAAAEQRGLELAVAALAEGSLGHKHLRVTVADMADMWKG